MADSLSIPPVSLSGVASISSLSLLQATSGTSLSSVAALNGGASTIVALSAGGQLLSAVSSFQTRLLDTLQAGTADVSPAGVVATAQQLVSAFNTLQSNIAAVSGVFGTAQGSTLADQFVPALNQLITASFADSASQLGALQTIGIDFTTTASGGTASGATLGIDQSRLEAAVAADAGGAQALLTGATQSLIGLASGFESSVASAAVSLAALGQVGGATGATVDLGTALGLQSTSPLSGTGVALDQLQSLAADTVLNTVQLSDLDLAPAGLDASTIAAASGVRQGALSADLLSQLNSTATNPAITTLQTAAAAPSPPASTQESSSATVATPVEAVSQTNPASPTNPVTTPAAASTTAASSSPAAANTAETAAADLSVSMAALASQNTLSPAAQALGKLLDPAFAAISAALRMQDFAAPAVINPGAPVRDLPAPISPVARARAIGVYQDVAGAVFSVAGR